MTLTLLKARYQESPRNRLERRLMLNAYVRGGPRWFDRNSIRARVLQRRGSHWRYRSIEAMRRHYERIDLSYAAWCRRALDPIRRRHP